MLVIVASLAVTAPAGAAAPEPTARARTVALSLSATVPISGTPSPYELEVSATRDAVRVTLAGGERGAAELEQEHTYSVDADALRCNRRLTRCRLDTGTALGSLGRIRLTFRAEGRPFRSVFRCESSNQVLSRTTTRRGEVRARVRLATRTGYFGTIRSGRGDRSVARSFEASISRRVDLGRDCDFGSGETTCAGPEMNLSAFWSQERQSLFAFIDGARRGFHWVSFSAEGDSGVDGVELDHQLTADPGRRFLRDTGGTDPLSTVAIDLSALGPDITGTARFEATDDLRVGDPYDGCIDRRRSGTLGIDATVRWHGFPASSLTDTSASVWATVRT